MAEPAIKLIFVSERKFWKAYRGICKTEISNDDRVFKNIQMHFQNITIKSIIPWYKIVYSISESK
jgi:hypothetical protein